MKRRHFLRLLIVNFFVVFFFFNFSLNAKSLKIKFNIKIKGDLDDDLFILKSDGDDVTFLECFQMHNPHKYFIYDSRLIPSKRIYGRIDFDKDFFIKRNEVFLIATANEREEISPKKELRKRTHFKSVDLFVDDEVLIPSLMPEYNDVPNYPTWFDAKNLPCEASYKNYNYYKLWENSVINIGLVFYKEQEATIYLIDKDENILYKKQFFVSKKAKNAKFLKGHTLLEVDGSLYDGSSKNDQKIKKMAVYYIGIENKDNFYLFKLPYPFVYINRIFTKALK